MHSGERVGTGGRRCRGEGVFGLEELGVKLDG